MSCEKQVDLVKRGEQIIFGQNQLERLLARGWKLIEQTAENEQRGEDGQNICIVKCRLQRSAGLAK